jgi:site-specific DNA recombinase
MEIQEPKEKITAVYGRVSTARQEEENTIETQLGAVREYASKNNITVVKEYIDNGWSGDSLVRPALDQLRIDAKNNLWKAVLIYDPDRLARRYSYQELVMDELREAGIEVLFVTTTAPKNSEDKILYGVKGLFAEYERAKISERFRLGKLRKARDGHVMMSVGTYGYTFVKRTIEKQSHCVINDFESPIVKDIFSWVGNDGLSIRAVVRKLKELKIKPRKSVTGLWSLSTLSHMLRNRAYIGETHFGGTKNVVAKNPIKLEMYRRSKKTSSVRTPEKDWIKIQSMPKLIDEDLFNRVQEALSKNSKRRTKAPVGRYLLTGKIWCSCGYRRCGHSCGSGRYYYACNQAFNIGPLKTDCTERQNLRAFVIEDLVWNHVSELMLSEQMLSEHLGRWMGSKKNVEQEVLSVELEHKQIQKLKEEENRYITAYGSGAISVEKLKEYTTSIKEKIYILEQRIIKVEKDKEERNLIKIPQQSEIKDFVYKAKGAIKEMDRVGKQRILSLVLDKVVVNGDSIVVNGLFPVTAMFHEVLSVPIDKTLCNIPFSSVIKMPAKQLPGIHFGFLKKESYIGR